MIYLNQPHFNIIYWKPLKLQQLSPNQQLLVKPEHVLSCSSSPNILEYSLTPTVSSFSSQFQSFPCLCKLLYLKCLKEVLLGTTPQGHIHCTIIKLVLQIDLSQALAQNMICSGTYPQHQHKIGSVVGPIPSTIIKYDLQQDLYPALACNRICSWTDPKHKHIIGSVVAPISSTSITYDLYLDLWIDILFLIMQDYCESATSVTKI